MNQFPKFVVTASLLFLHFMLVAAEDKHPNVMLIAVDDLNDWIGCLGGNPQVKTPSIDRLASKGVLFTNAHCQAPICNPSRASIMTSLYPGTTGIYFNSGNIEDSPETGNNVLLTRRFEKEGYYVIGAGKLYHAGDQKYMTNYAGNFGGFGPYPKEKFTSFPGIPAWDWGIYPERDDQMPDYMIADWGVKQLKKSYDQPLFLGLGFYRPHVPLYVPKKWFDLYPEVTTRLPDVNQQDLIDISQYAIKMTHLKYITDPPHPYHEWMLEHNQWRNFVRSYLASISFVDQQIGRIMDAYENSSFKDNTYIVLFGDNGFHLGEKEAWAKQTLWEESTRVPMIIVGPGIPAGKVCKKPVQLMDIYPTLLELTEHAADPKHEGHSFATLLSDTEADWPYMALSCFGPGNFTIRSERYRYIHYNDGSEEFYDHSNDPNEWNNQISKPELAVIINKHRAVLPEMSHPVIGSGSTGHKVFDYIESWSKTQSASAVEKRGQLLTPEFEMAIIRQLNLEDRIANRQAILPKNTEEQNGGDDVSGEWICFTTMFLNGPTGKGIMYLNLKQDVDTISGIVGQLKHPFDPPSTIRTVNEMTTQGNIKGKWYKGSGNNMIVLERQGSSNSPQMPITQTWAIFTAVIGADGRTATGQLVNAGGNYGTMLMVKREALSHYQYLLTDKDHKSPATRWPEGIEQLEDGLSTESLQNTQTFWWKSDKNKDGYISYEEFPHPDWHRANLNCDEYLSWEEELTDRVLRPLSLQGKFQSKYAKSPKKEWSSWHDWGCDRPDFEWLFPFIDRNRDGKIIANEYTAFEDQLKTYLDKSWPKTNEWGQTGTDVYEGRPRGPLKTSYDSKEEWSRYKGTKMVWIFPFIDVNNDGKINSDEHQDFEDYKKKHVDWQMRARMELGIKPPLDDN